jgi:hypothetical protein
MTKPITIPVGALRGLTKGSDRLDDAWTGDVASSVPNCISAAEVGITGDATNCRTKRSEQQTHHLRLASTTLLLAIRNISLQFQIINFSFSM